MEKRPKQMATEEEDDGWEVRWRGRLFWNENVWNFQRHDFICRRILKRLITPFVAVLQGQHLQLTIQIQPIAHW